MIFATLRGAATSPRTILYEICYSLGRGSFTALHPTWYLLLFGAQRLHSTPFYMEFAILCGAAASPPIIIPGIFSSFGRSSFTALHPTWYLLLFWAQRLQHAPFYMKFATLWGAAKSTRINLQPLTSF